MEENWMQLSLATVWARRFGAATSMNSALEEAASDPVMRRLGPALLSWVAENFITHDTQILSAQANEKQIALGVDLAKKAARFDKTADLPYDVRRKLNLGGHCDLMLVAMDAEHAVHLDSGGTA